MGGDVTRRGLRRLIPGRRTDAGAADRQPGGDGDVFARLTTRSTPPPVAVTAGEVDRPLDRRWQRRRRAEDTLVGEAEPTDYYGQPVIRGPVWKPLDIGGYLYLGGLAGGSSLLALGADLAGMPGLARTAKVTAATAITGSLVALIHDLGRPDRFLNMLRVAKPTSPMSVGSWLLAGYAPLTLAAAASAVTGRAPLAGLAATAGAGVLAPAVASYTAVLLADTAVPAWHDAHRELPVVFVASSAMAAGGAALVLAPMWELPPARRFALAGAVVEMAALEVLQHRLGDRADAYRTGRPRRLLDAGRVLTVIGAVGAVLSPWNRPAGRIGGACLATASAATRFAVFHAGRASADDPRHTVGPQRRRLGARPPAPEG